jgi:hypothetical protein
MLDFVNPIVRRKVALTLDGIAFAIKRQLGRTAVRGLPPRKADVTFRVRELEI